MEARCCVRCCKAAYSSARMHPAATRPVGKLAAATHARVQRRECFACEPRRCVSSGGVCRAAPAVLDHPSAESVSATTDGQLQKLRLITAIKTPYLTSGRFDLRTFDSIVEHQACGCIYLRASCVHLSSPYAIGQHCICAGCAQIANGVDGLIIGGTTGEGQLMSWDEHIMLIAHTVNRCGP